jgi:acetyl-CoA carboxylase carboxyltransferase component
MSFTWDTALKELERRRQLALELGGPEAIERQHRHGKLTIRERIDAITDRFYEVGGLATFSERDPSGSGTRTLPSSYVCGLAEIDGRPVAVGGEDYTIKAGIPNIYLDRIKGGIGGFIEDLSHEFRIPLVLMVEGTGGDVSAIDDFGHAYLVSTYSWRRPFDLLREVPVITAVLGPAAGGAAGRAVLSHFSVMASNSVLFAGGPPVVRRATGLEVDKYQLGGADIHTRISGAIDNVAENEEDAFRQIRAVLSYLPPNVWEMPPRGDRSDSTDRSCDEILEIVPENRRRAYNPRGVIESVLDRGSFFEIGGGWGRSLTTGLGRIDGIPIGVLANNPMVLGGAMDGSAADKQVRFVDFCSTFHLPLLYFVDVPGFMVGPDAEAAGVVRRGMRAIQSLYDSDLPILTIQVRKAYGMAVNATADPTRLCLRIAWPSGEWGDIPIEGGVEAGFRREIEAASDPGAYRREVEERLLAASDPWKTVEAFAVEDMVDPRETRRIAAMFFNASLNFLRTRLGPQTRGVIRP